MVKITYTIDFKNSETEISAHKEMDEEKPEELVLVYLLERLFQNNFEDFSAVFLQFAEDHPEAFIKEE